MRREPVLDLLKAACGRMLNAAGAPGFIRRQQCRRLRDTAVEVRVTRRFTIVAVNNIQLMFRRLSGELDGIVVGTDDCFERRVRATTEGLAAQPAAVDID
jgi:hypothetical protein